MRGLANGVSAGFLLLIFSGVFVGPASAQGDIHAKMKQLEQLEARIDAKLKRLENLEARLESRLETGVQPIAARPQGPLAAPANGSATHLPSSVAGAMAPQANQLWGGQVSFRGGYTHLDKSEDGAIFSGSGTGRNGWMVGGALDIPLIKEPFFNNTLLGQISMDFSGINGKTSSPLGLNTGNQSLYKIAVSPKYRIDTLGDLRPWIIPIGLSFLVNSPPSDSAAYLTVGGTTGAGVEYVIADRFSLGVALSYNFYSKAQNRANSNHLSVGPYVGINF